MIGRRAGRRWLAVLIAGPTLGLALGLFLLPGNVVGHAAVTPPLHCRHKPCPPDPTPTAAPTPSAAPTRTGEVQAISVPTATPYDDPRATPGPIQGTLVTPEPVLALPVAAPALAAHPQGDPGLTVLLGVGAALALVTIGALTVALALH